MREDRIKVILFSTLLLTYLPGYATTKTFYALSRAQNFQSTERGTYFIQMGNFSRHINAIEFEHRLKKIVEFPVAIHHSKQHFIVIVGPMRNAAEVRKASQQLSETKTQTRLLSKPATLNLIPTTQFSDAIDPTEYHSKKRIAPTFYEQIFPSSQVENIDTKILKAENTWFAGLGAGVQQLNVVNPIYVSNGSGFSYPYNYDQFSTQTNAQAVVAAEFGYHWKNTSPWISGKKWFPGYAVSLYYNHLFSTNIGDQIEQYSIPAFTNYQYTWKTSADVLLAIARLDLIEYEQFTPFVQVGLGGSLNHASQYGETAYPNVTTRINPAFSDQTTGAFAYDLGAGIDWKFHPQFSLSLMYQFQDLGNVASGFGVSTWSQDKLDSNTYQTNLALLKLDYYFSL